MASSIEKIIDGMPTPTLTKIIGSPNYEAIKQINDELTANAYSIQTNLGCGTVGYARLTLLPATYATISIAAWIPPPNPGTQAGIPANSTAIQIATINRSFDTASTIYATYRMVGNALKKQLLAAVEDIFICSLKQPYIGYGNVTVLDLLTHLFMTYAQISPGDLALNEARMKKEYDPNLPIERIFQQIEDAVAYADHGNDPISAVTVTNRAYTLVFQTGIFVDDCKEWKRLPPFRKLGSISKRSSPGLIRNGVRATPPPLAHSSGQTTWRSRLPPQPTQSPNSRLPPPRTKQLWFPSRRRYRASPRN